MTITFVQLSLALLVLRLILGAVFFAHGAQKVLGWFGGYGLSGTVGFFKTGLKIPAPLAYLAAFAEFLGGIALLLGIFTHVAALGIFIVMAVAIIKVHLSEGFLTVPNKSQGYEFPLTLAAVALVLVILGGGAYSIDRLL
jgi:putative oxidoreductase